MNPFLQLAVELALILLAAKLAGYLSTRLGQPSVLGEILVGVLLGPSLLDIARLPFVNSATLPGTIQDLGQLGVLLLMFIAGLELHLDELLGTRRVAALAGTLGLALSVLLGYGAGRLFGLPGGPAAFLGLILGASSVGISAQTLMELKQLRSRVGLGLLGAAVFDDVLSILLLSLFFVLQSPAHDWLDLLFLLLRLAGFLLLAFGFGRWLLPPLARRVRTLPISQGPLALALIVLLVYAVAAEALGGLAAITGAFLAGLMFAGSGEKETLEPRLSALAYGFFVPIFFVNIGLHTRLADLVPVLGLAGMLVLAALAGKILGAGGGARLAGFTWLESARLGVGMMPRGEVSLILASVGLSTQLLPASGFTAVVGVVIVCMVITPPLLRLLIRNPAQPLDQPDGSKENT
jgi:Kef-type K+ transport system membrane component KefB